MMLLGAMVGFESELQPDPPVGVPGYRSNIGLVCCAEGKFVSCIPDPVCVDEHSPGYALQLPLLDH